jgi:hypothetical protein
VIEAREQVFSSAYANHPERFMRGCPKPQSLPAAAWFNPPQIKNTDQKKGFPRRSVPENPMRL